MERIGDLMVDFDFEIRRVKFSELEGVMDVNETTLPENYPRFFYERIIEKFHESFLIAHPKTEADNRFPVEKYCTIYQINLLGDPAFNPYEPCNEGVS